MSDQTIRDLIEHQAQQRPDAVYALATESDSEISYAGLAADCRSVGRLLRSMGSMPGEVVSFVLPNGLTTLRLLLGSMYGGWSVNPVNLLAQPLQMRYVLEHSDSRLVFVSPDRETEVRTLLVGLERDLTVVVVGPDGDLPVPRGSSSDLASQFGLHPGKMDKPDPDAMALLMYTSGTTGQPKGVMLTQSNLVANATAIGREHALTASDRVLAVLPLYHINAFAVTMLAPLSSGGSLAIAPRFSVDRFWRQAAELHCTWINVVPTIISYLVEKEERPSDVATIRFCRSASAALPPDSLRAFEAKFGIGVVETMGLTETAAPAFSNPMDSKLRKIGSVGQASGCEARVVDGELQPLPDGSTGEVLIRGANVMKGYYKNPAATQATFTSDRWLRTGDLGHRDSDGFYFITGRIKELIIKGGENIAPREIDEVLLRHPAVLEAAAVGIADRHYGQEILACIVLREGEQPDVDGLRRFCHQHLGRYKTPAQFRFVDALPRGPSGKVQRLKLLDTGSI